MSVARMRVVLFPILLLSATSCDVTHPGVDPEHVEGPDEASVADGGRALHHAAALGADVRQQARALVEVDAGEVHLPQVARVVHVVQQHVDVGRQADPCGQSGKAGQGHHTVNVRGASLALLSRREGAGWFCLTRLVHLLWTFTLSHSTAKEYYLTRRVVQEHTSRDTCFD